MSGLQIKPNIKTTIQIQTQKPKYRKIPKISPSVYKPHQI